MVVKIDVNQYIEVGRMLTIDSKILHHFKGFCSSASVIMMFVYMKGRFSLSYRDLEEMMEIRGAHVDHSTLQRWVMRFAFLIRPPAKVGK